MGVVRIRRVGELRWVLWEIKRVGDLSEMLVQAERSISVKTRKGVRLFCYFRCYCNECTW